MPCDSLATQDDSRFEYFVGTVLPQVLRSKQAHTAVFIPSYFDYVRVRNHLMKNKASVVNVHEYSRGSEVRYSRRALFLNISMLLFLGHVLETDMRTLTFRVGPMTMEWVRLYIATHMKSRT